MCGIVGVYQKNNFIDREDLMIMNRAISHRGPDDEGYFIDGNFGMAICRLSIIDLSGGHQPMSNESKTIWLVFNGEIYNFLQVKNTLINKGYKFNTNSDTEVILHAYEEYGVGCLKYFNGMFCFCIYDKNKQIIFIARDRIGEKPLYYYHDGNHFYFASELKSILANPNFNPELSHEALDCFFSFNYIPAPSSIIKNVKKLLPGDYLFFSLKSGEFIEKSYWRLEDSFYKRTEDNFEKAKYKIMDLLSQSVKNQLISDVPLGIFLSGGVDSSAIVAIASQIGSRNIETYSVISDDKSFDEREYSRLVAETFHTKHTEIKIGHEEAISLIPHLANFLDEPFGDASIVPTYLLCQEARRHITVALGGDGGDELFAGYPTHLAHTLSSWYLLMPGFIRNHILEKFLPKLPVSLKDFSFDFKVKRFLAGVYEPAELRHFIWQSAVFPREKNLLYSDYFKAEIKHNFLKSYQIANINFLNDFDLFSKIEFLDLKFYLPDDILFKSDRASMANSLELRLPFLDYQLVEYANSLQKSFKLKNFTTKYIFKKGLEDILPRKILYHRKKGFGIPLSKWLRYELYNFATDILSKDKINNIGLFNFKQVEKLLKDHKDGLKDNRKALWALIIFNLWHEKWLKKN